MASADEGYVKYSCEHAQGPAPEHPAMEVMNALRAAMVAKGLIGTLPGGVGYGNVSVRAEGGAFVVSQTATGHIPALEPRHYALVTACDIAANKVSSRGPARPSSESMTHAAIYLAAPQAGCVFHLHSRPLFDWMLAAGLPATAPQAAFGTPAMAESVAGLAARSPEGGAIVMTGHQDGVLVYG
ncbi:MAG: class II aldolase/adducin family protein, partial [Duodenibacillus sp.]|nr:class II aldolase/adducin family protein [Duodenibacillus sp.]